MKKLMLGTALALTGTMAMAEYPTGPVQMIVPWPPGDFEDILT
ncbi:MAG: tripartite tricarboxylate transporter substrate binding protein, partial [Pseudomonadota bacterium]